MKLVENLRAVETGNRRVIEDLLHTISYNTTPNAEYEIKYAKEYSIFAKIGAANNWIMPAAPLYKRLPLVRHIRTILLKAAVDRHYSQGIGSIGLRSGYDEWVLYGIWHGLERGECNE